MTQHTCTPKCGHKSQGNEWAPSQSQCISMCLIENSQRIEPKVQYEKICSSRGKLYVEIWTHYICGSVDSVFELYPYYSAKARGLLICVPSQRSINISPLTAVSRVTLQVCKQKMTYACDHRNTQMGMCFLHTNQFCSCQQTRCWNFHNSRRKE